MEQDRRALTSLALGRIFGMLQRPERPGDAEEYERCRAIVLDGAEPIPDYAPNYVRDRLKGAAGD